jgi:tetratricopeptide (TPR) repeat protein
MRQFETYAINPYNSKNIIAVADYFEQNNLLGMAATEYLRAAEYSSNDDETYACMLKVYELYQQEKLDSLLCEQILEKLIALYPGRPEAYYYYALRVTGYDAERSYMYASMGLQNASIDLVPLPLDFSYKSIAQLYYHKAMVGWWCGKPEESRELFNLLLSDYIDDLPDYERSSAAHNLYTITVNDVVEVRPPCDITTFKTQVPILGQFPYVTSRSYQDFFVLSLLDGKTDGFFVEVGVDGPVHKNNTYMLENYLGWHGIAFKPRESVDEYALQRTITTHSNKVESVYSFDKRLSDVAPTDKIIDYLHFNFGIDGNYEKFLNDFPFSSYLFRVVTISHNDFADHSKTIKNKSREIMQSLGYTLVAGNIAINGKYSYEDWWVFEDLVNTDVVNQIKQSSDCLKTGDQVLMGTYTSIPEEFKTEEPVVNTLYAIKKQKLPRVWIVDDFYENPEQIRDFALSQEYHIGGLGKDYIGRRTYQQFLFPGLKEEFEKIMGMRITKWEDYSMNGRFQTNWGGDPLAYHADFQTFAGMIYLTPNAPYSCGTTLHAHKKTRIRNVNEIGSDKCFEGHNLDSTIYEPVDVIGNVYNRLAIFDAKCIHSASNYFGYDAHTGRLWHMFFFDAE